MSSKLKFNTIPEALKDIRLGKMIVVVDDEDRENEGDLTMAAEKVTPEAINFMAKHGRGLICLSLTPERVEHLQLPMMTTDNTSSFGTAFTISIEAKKGVTTGISAADRATTIKAAINPKKMTTSSNSMRVKDFNGRYCSQLVISSSLSTPSGP